MSSCGRSLPERTLLNVDAEIVESEATSSRSAMGLNAHMKAGRLPWTVKAGWAFGEVGLASYVAIVAIYLLYFMTDVLHIAAGFAAVLLIIPRIWNIVIDPLVGQLSDYTKTRIGRRRPYLLGGALLWGCSFAALFNLPRLDGGWGFATLFLVVFGLTTTGLSLYQVPYSALATEMSDDYSERIQLVSWKNVAARIAALLGIAGAPRIVQLASVESTGYRLMGITFGALIIISGLVAFFSTAPAPSIPAIRKKTANWRAQVAMMRANRPLLILISSYAIYCLGQLPFVGLLVYYVTDVLHKSPGLVGILYPITSLTSAIVTPAWAHVAERLGKRRLCLISWVGAGLSWTWPLFVPINAEWMIYPAMVVVGLFQAGGDLLPNTMVPDVADVAEMVSGERREGAVYGLWIFQQQTVLACGGLIVGLALQVIGYHGHEAHPAPAVVHGIIVAMTIPSCALALIASALLLLYKLPEMQLQQLREQRTKLSSGVVTPSP